MAIATKDEIIEIVKFELTSGITNLELSNDSIVRNIDRALAYSSGYWNYTDYKTVDINSQGSQSGYIDLKDLDDSGMVPTIVNVFPTTAIATPESALLGVGSANLFLRGIANWGNQLTNYANMLSKMSMLESILGRNARVVGDKLYVANYYQRVTIEYIPNIVEVENINQGSWIEWIINYAAVLSKLQIAQARGKYTVDSNPFQTNASQLIDEATTEKLRLEEELNTKSILLVSR